MSRILAQPQRATRQRRYVLLLAAGASRRLGRPKMLLELAGTALVRQRAAAALCAAPSGCVVVTGAAHGRVVAALAGLPVRIVRNRRYRDGQASSIASGVAALPFDASHVLVLAVDQWAIDASVLARLLRRAGRRPLAASYAGTCGIPVVFPRAWFARLASLHGGPGARPLLADQPIDRLSLPAAARDLDTAADAREARRAALRARPAGDCISAKLRPIPHSRAAAPSYTGGCRPLWTIRG